MTPDAFDPERLGRRFDDAAFDVLRNGMAKPRLPRPAKGEPFLGGPIPMRWIEQAAPLPGHAWKLACALWFEALCKKEKWATVQPTRRTLRRFGLLSQSTYYRALTALEAAGLVSVEARVGRRPLVTILSVNNAGTLAPCTPAREVATNVTSDVTT
jgi:hypothetical protein